MIVNSDNIKDGRVPVIDFEYKVIKNWKNISRVFIDGDPGVNIMSEFPRRQLDVKKYPFRVRMVDQRVVQPLGLIEGV